MNCLWLFPPTMRLLSHRLTSNWPQIKVEAEANNWLTSLVSPDAAGSVGLVPFSSREPLCSSYSNSLKDIDKRIQI